MAASERRAGSSAPAGWPPVVQVVVTSRTVWRSLLLTLLLAGLAAIGLFVLEDGGGVLFTVLIAWFASIAMEPAVSRLAARMPRGLATALVMLGVAVFLGLFFYLFGQLLAEQVTLAVQALPSLAESALERVNERFGTSYNAQSALEAVGITTDTLTRLGTQAVSGVLGFVVSVLSAFFSVFTFLFFTFYFSADAPRLRRWVASLFPTRGQGVVVTVWSLAVEKAGGYVAARVLLAAINGVTTSVFLLVIGMPYWLVLGIWTGVVAQFVPTVGTYIAIALPVLVGLLGGSPVQGILALAWGIGYQQVENLTIEPHISARAVDLHPAVSFASVLLGAALFGAGGAVLAVPVAAFLLALFEGYRSNYTLLPELADGGATMTPAAAPPSTTAESSTPEERSAAASAADDRRP